MGLKIGMVMCFHMGGVCVEPEFGKKSVTGPRRIPSPETRTHFQHVSEHYMVTRTSLLILTLKRKVQQVPISTIVYSTAPTIVLQ